MAGSWQGSPSWAGHGPDWRALELAVRQARLGTTEPWTGAGDCPGPREAAQSPQFLPGGAAQPVAAAPRGTPEGHRGPQSPGLGILLHLLLPKALETSRQAPFGRDSMMPLALAGLWPLISEPSCPCTTPKGLQPRMTTLCHQSSLDPWHSKARSQVKGLKSTAQGHRDVRGPLHVRGLLPRAVG